MEFFIGDIVFALSILFVRLGAAFMILPGLANATVSVRIRLFFAVSFTLMIYPSLVDVLPSKPDNLGVLLALIVSEALIGIFLGTVVRILLAALEVAGTIVATHTGLANAFLFNQQLRGQSTLTAMMFANTGILLFFITDLHHMFFHALHDSYIIFPAGGEVFIGDMAERIASLVNAAFSIGVRLAAPFMILGLIFFLGIGLLARTMPQMQIFFIAMPAQTLLGTALLTLTLSAMLMLWLSFMQTGINDYILH